MKLEQKIYQKQKYNKKLKKILDWQKIASLIKKLD